MLVVPCDQVEVRRTGTTRRRFLQHVSAAALASGALGWRESLAVEAARLKKEGRALILLWMQGGPSQLETFDPKPGTENGGPTEAIETAVPGVRIAAGWERTARVLDQMAVLRSLTNKEGNHQRATYQLHTGYVPLGSVKHPSLTANVAREIGPEGADLPPVVSVGRTIGSGFLGVDYEPFAVQNAGRLPQNVSIPTDSPRFRRRLGLVEKLDGEFVARGAESVVEEHRRLYGKASGLALSSDLKAFDIASEPAALQSRYGDTNFGRGCLLARRLVEAGVTCVEVVSNGWDTHQENFAAVRRNAGEVDPGMATLIEDLRDRGMLERTVVVWMGEFGRTPRINPRTGRDHYPRVFNGLVAGGGLRKGLAVGRSSPDGMSVADRPIEPADLFCTLCQSLGVDPRKENVSPLGRPMKIVDGGEPIRELIG
jgi:hypothetical protein